MTCRTGAVPLAEIDPVAPRLYKPATGRPPRRGDPIAGPRRFEGDMPPRVRITEAGGFVGAYLARKLVEGREVHCLVRPNRPYPWLAGFAGGCAPRWADLNDTSSLAFP